MLLVIKDMREYFGLRLVKVANASMQGVGTKMGTVSWCEPLH
jgi:hypothetical protein